MIPCHETVNGTNTSILSNQEVKTYYLPELLTIFK